MIPVGRIFPTSSNFLKVFINFSIWFNILPYKTFPQIIMIVATINFGLIVSAAD